MTDLNKGMIAASNDNHITVKQAVGSDVAATGEDSQQTISTSNQQETSFGSSALAQKPVNDNQRRSSAEIDGRTYTQNQIDMAISSYGLEDTIKVLQPKEYTAKKKIGITDSITQLLKDLKLAGVLKTIPKRPGAHPGKGLPSKRALVMYLYGLKRYGADLIEGLECVWVRKAIKFAVKSQVVATPALVKRLKKEHLDKYKVFKAEQEKEAKKQAFADKIKNAKKAEEGMLFDGGIVDLTQCQPTNWGKTQSLPLADNAIVLVATTPDTLPQALKLIKDWELAYVDNVVWDRDRIKNQYTWSKNQHTNILIAARGEVSAPINDFKLESVHFDHQNPTQTDLPDYFYSTMENLVPGGNFFEMFSARLYNSQWAII